MRTPTVDDVERLGVSRCDVLFANCQRPATLVLTYPDGVNGGGACVNCGDHMARAFGELRAESRRAGIRSRGRCRREWLSTALGAR